MKTLFIDVDSQMDFLYPAGALYVPGAERVVANIARLNHYAAANGITVISTVDSHTENDPEFKSWPPHCIAGTTGQHKAEATLLARRIVLPNCEVPLVIEGAQQIVIEKQSVDVATARNFARVVERLAADRFVLYGVVTEICVLFAARALVPFGKPITLVTDAVAGLTDDASRAAQAEIQAAGGALATTSEVFSALTSASPRLCVEDHARGT